MLGKWALRYQSGVAFPYGDEISYLKAAQFLNNCGRIEDWGCGTAWARRYFKNYFGIDGTPGFADHVEDLRLYRSKTDCIHLRHVLEHNLNWQIILENALESFTKRLVLTIFTPLAPQTHLLGTTKEGVPEIAFCRDDLVKKFSKIILFEENFLSNTFYGKEHMFYLDKQSHESPTKML